ncbi:MAG: molybdopterin-guanine dinucleotide biosynthesis protein B [bacterium]|nr:MAG: molybdopterin-guanine dinucleotide biosynthesis protein B [bacterium]
MIPTVLFVARSETGKTTLIEGVIGRLASMGYRVGALKHAGHPVKMDTDGTDSWRFSEAGSDVTIVTSPSGIMLTRRWQEEMPLEGIIAEFGRDLDILLVEGYKGTSFPKIEVFRSETGADLLCRGEQNDPALVALAADIPLDEDVPVFSIDDHGSIARFLVERFLKKQD